MGYGEVAGNQSVHWEIDHEVTTPITVTPNNGNRPTQPHRVNHQQARLRGRDPKAVAEINGDGYSACECVLTTRASSKKKSRQPSSGRLRRPAASMSS